MGLLRSYSMSSAGSGAYRRSLRRMAAACTLMPMTMPSATQSRHRAVMVRSFIFTPP